MPLKEMSKEDQEIVLQCMRAIAEGDDIDDWEFHARLGIERPTLKRIILRWPDLDDRKQDSDEFLAINNCMNEICHGIRLTAEKWSNWFTRPRDAVEQVYRNWLRLGGQTRGGIR